VPPRALDNAFRTERHSVSCYNGFNYEEFCKLHERFTTSGTGAPPRIQNLPSSPLIPPQKNVPQVCYSMNSLTYLGAAVVARGPARPPWFLSE